MLELMARSCLPIGEVLKPKPKDIENRKVIIRDPRAEKRRRLLSFLRKLRIGSKNISETMGSKPVTGFYVENLILSSDFKLIATLTKPSL